MTMIELRQQVEVDTPKGRGRIFIITDYGSEIEKIFTVITYNGEFWEFPPDKMEAIRFECHSSGIFHVNLASHIEEIHQSIYTLDNLFLVGILQSEIIVDLFLLKHQPNIPFILLNKKSFFICCSLTRH